MTQTWKSVLTEGKERKGKRSKMHITNAAQANLDVKAQILCKSTVALGIQLAFC